MTAEEMAGEMDETLEAMIVELSAQAIAEFVGDIGTNKEHWTQRALGLNDRFERILRPHFDRHAKLREAAEAVVSTCDEMLGHSSCCRVAYGDHPMGCDCGYECAKQDVNALRAALEQENKG